MAEDRQLMTLDVHDVNVVLLRDGDDYYAAIVPICDGLGIDSQNQVQRLRGHPVFAKGVTLSITPSAGGPQRTWCLRSDLVGAWLMIIHPNRVRPEVRDRLIALQTDCARAIDRHLRGVATGLVDARLGEIEARIGRLESVPSRYRKSRWRLDTDVAEDPLYGTVKEALARLGTDRVVSKDLRAALGLEETQSDYLRLGKIMRALGWVRTVARIGDRLRRCYTHGVTVH